MPILNVGSHVWNYWANHFPNVLWMELGMQVSYTSAGVVPETITSPEEEFILPIPPPERHTNNTGNPVTVGYHHPVSTMYDHSWVVSTGVDGPKPPPVVMPTYGNPHVPIQAVDFSSGVPIHRSVDIPSQLADYALLNPGQTIEITARRIEIPVVNHFIYVDFVLSGVYDVKVAS